MMASPGFLQNGVSRHLFERWCDDSRNGVIIAGYTVEGTLAHQLLEQPQTITCQDNVIKPRRCQIEHVSFSAHVDYNDNLRFIKEVAPDNIILVHGEKNGMKRLKEELEKEIKRNWPVAHRPHVATPDNQTVVNLRFSKAITAECVGMVGQDLLDKLVVKEEQEVSGVTPGSEMDVAIPEKAVLVSENFVSKIVAASELSTFTSCRRGRVIQKIVIPVPTGLLGASVQRGGLLRALVPYLDEIFESVIVDDDETCYTAPPIPPSLGGGVNTASTVSLVVQGLVRVCEDHSSSSAAGAPASVVVAWEASPSTDLVADCAVGTILQTLSVSSLLHLSLLGQSLGSRADHKAAKAGAKSKRSKNEDEIGAGGESIESVPMYKGAKKRNVHGHVHVRTVSEAVLPSSSDSAGEVRINEIINKMRSGAVDPSKAVPADCIAFSSSSVQAMDNRTRLENLRSQLLAMESSSFSFIKLTADGLKLIFSGSAAGASKKGSKKSKVEAEAYVYVVFAQGRHEAVVSCEDEALRSQVIAAFGALT